MSIDKIIAYEQGELSDDEIVDLFQSLIDDGSAWQLQGNYGRTAHQLIASGRCSPKPRAAAVPLVEG